MSDFYPAKDFYSGGRASQYQEPRARTAQWAREQAIVESFLATLPRGSTVLDVPVGTGRFLDTYERCGLLSVGMDVSVDMLAQARKSSARSSLRLLRGDAERLPLRSVSVDYVVCTRFLNWLPAPVFERVIGELSRTARKGMLVEIHTAEPLPGFALLLAFVSHLRRSPLRALRSLAGAARRRVVGSSDAPRRYSSPCENSSAQSPYHHRRPLELERALLKHGLRIEKTWHVRVQLRFDRRELRELLIYHLLPSFTRSNHAE